MVVISISCEEEFDYVMTLGGSIAGGFQGLVWTLVGSTAWMWKIMEQAGGKWSG